MKTLARNLALVILIGLIAAPALVHALVLPIEKSGQEQSNWCWAACTKMVLCYYDTLVAQCDIADYACIRRWCATCPCCTRPWDTSCCNKTNCMYNANGCIDDLLLNWGVTASGYAGSMTLAAVKTEIDGYRPVMVNWYWSGGGGHFIVIRGYDDSNNLHYVNPLPVNEGEYHICTHAWMVSGGSHTWEHTLEMDSAHDPPRWKVKPGGGGGYFSTIQAAIDAAVDDIDIDLADGTYTGDGNRDLDYNGKDIEIWSMSGPLNVTILVQGTPAEPHRAFHFHNGEDMNQVLFGVAIATGYETEGGAILCENGSSPLINNCMFFDNDAVDGGAIVCKDGSSPRMSWCTFEDNSASNRGGALYLTDNCTSWIWHCFFDVNNAGDGGAVYVERSDVDIEDVRLSNHGAANGGAVCVDSSTVDFEMCTMYLNSATASGGAVQLRNSSVGNFLSCTLSQNSATQFGGGIKLSDATSLATLESSIIAFGSQGAAVDCSGGPVPAVTCCDIYSNAGGAGCIATLIDTLGNIARDPIFCDQNLGDYSLRDDSPCTPYSLPNDSCNWIGSWQSIGCNAPSPFLAPGQTLPGLWEGDGKWADLDGDGDPDLVVSGKDGAGTSQTRIYLNENSSLALQQELTGVRSTGSDCLAWGDVDGDGDLDLALAGTSDSEGRIARIYINDGAGNLAWEPAHDLVGVGPASLAWGDMDNDGDLDLLVTGHDGGGDLALLYRNEPPGLLMVDLGTALTGVRGGSADWADMDCDGDLDLLLTGANGTDRRAIFYRNEPCGTLVDEGDLGVTGVVLSDAAWGDYNNDGFPDLLVTGETGVGGPRHARVYENLGGGGFAITEDLSAIYRSSCAWGDFDNNGELDVVIAGYTGTSLLTVYYLNHGGVFSLESGVTARYEGSLSWIDLNGNGKLDLMVMGYDWYDPYLELWDHTGGILNSRPTAPTELFCEGESGLALSWSGATDAQTPAAGLYYNVRVGTTPGSNDICSGACGVSLLGNVGQNMSLDLDLPDGTYYWSVQTIDGGMLASYWSSEQECYVGDLSGVPDTTPLTSTFDLEPNYPNPFNPSTTIQYTVAAAGRVALTIYDPSGRLIRRLVAEIQNPGQYSINWDGRDMQGTTCASGVYFYRLETRGKRETNKMVLVR